MENVERVVEELKTKKFVQALILFGSHARGKATPVSDIDLCVIDDEKFPLSKRREAYQFSTDKIKISLFSDLPLYIQYEVFRGKPLFIRNKKYFHRLKEKIVLDYLHTKWLWESYFELRKKMGKWSIGAR